MPFADLIKQDRRLADLRREYAARTAEEREAAEWAYEASIGNRLFNRGLELSGQEGPGPAPWPEGIAALAIDPTYAPAILTVGSIEYQLGRRDEAVEWFHSLLKLPTDTPELAVIINKAGNYLLSEKDHDRSAELDAAASPIFPRSTVILGGLGYSLVGKYSANHVLIGTQPSVSDGRLKPACLVLGFCRIFTLLRTTVRDQTPQLHPSTVNGGGMGAAEYQRKRPLGG